MRVFFRGFCAVILTLSILFYGSFSVNAMSIDMDKYEEDENIEIKVIENAETPFEFYDNPSDNLNGLLYSTSKPTNYWDLSSKGTYTANLVEVRASWLYTNYYFSPNSSGKLYLEYSLYPVEGTSTKVQIGVYNKSTDKFVKYYTVGTPAFQSLQITGLNPDQHYAIAFTALRDLTAYNSVQGTVKIHH